MDPVLLKSRAKRYQFLSMLFRDEIPPQVIAAMQKDEFLEPFNESVKGCGFVDLTGGAEIMTAFLKSDDAETLYRNLRYDYADLFLNAGGESGVSL